MTIKYPQNSKIYTQQFCEDYFSELIHCLAKYSGLSKTEAQKRVETSNILPNIKNKWSVINFFHEEPYYWAMTLIQTDPEWYRDPKLWPPPRDCYD